MLPALLPSVKPFWITCVFMSPFVCDSHLRQAYEAGTVTHTTTKTDRSQHRDQERAGLQGVPGHASELMLLICRASLRFKAPSGHSQLALLNSCESADSGPACLQCCKRGVER